VNACLKTFKSVGKCWLPLSSICLISSKSCSVHVYFGHSFESINIGTKFIEIGYQLCELLNNLSESLLHTKSNLMHSLSELGGGKSSFQELPILRKVSTLSIFIKIELDELTDWIITSFE
jgi:hypothetical protein